MDKMTNRCHKSSMTTSDLNTTQTKNQKVRITHSESITAPQSVHYSQDLGCQVNLVLAKFWGRQMERWSIIYQRPSLSDSVLTQCQQLQLNTTLILCLSLSNSPDPVHTQRFLPLVTQNILH